MTADVGDFLPLDTTHEHIRHFPLSLTSMIALVALQAFEAYRVAYGFGV
jgi:hypothetical protein